MSGVALWKAAAFAVPFITLVVGGSYLVAYLVTVLMGLPPSLGSPLAVRGVGGALVLLGLAVAGWVFSYRSPAAMMVSTYITLRKLVRGTAVEERSGRAEPLVVEGLQKYTRNPLYFGILVSVFGWGVVTASTCILVWSAALALWFGVILIPFEERELRALFGKQYEEYAVAVPMIVPFVRRRKRRTPKEAQSGGASQT